MQVLNLSSVWTISQAGSRTSSGDSGLYWSSLEHWEPSFSWLVSTDVIFTRVLTYIYSVKNKVCNKFPQANINDAGCITNKWCNFHATSSLPHYWKGEKGYVPMTLTIIYVHVLYNIPGNPLIHGWENYGPREACRLPKVFMQTANV